MTRASSPKSETAVTGTRTARSRRPRSRGLLEVVEIPLSKIDAPERPARRFLGDIAALADSMHTYGLQQPISVRAEGRRYVLTSGLRRLTAARLLRWTSVPAFVRSVSSDEAYVVDLVENLQRQDLTPEEEADALGELIRTRGWTLQQVANAVKRSVGYVSKRVRVFDDAVLRGAVVERGLAISTAEELLGLPVEQRAAVIERAIAERWDQVRAREALHDLEVGPDADLWTASNTDGRATSSRTRARVPAASGGERPRGFTAMIRGFHRAIANVRAQDLTASDRAALRALFRDLVMLARTRPEQTTPVFPPLPSTPRTRKSSSRASTSRRRRMS